MKNKKQLITFIFFIITSLNYAQNEQKNVRIFTNVLQNIDISHPNINIGVELDLKNKQGISLSSGIYFNNLFYQETASGWNIIFEYKKFISEQMFISSGIKYSIINYETTSEFENKENEILYLETYSIDKSIYDFYINVGKRIENSDYFYFDFFSGLGIRYKETIHSNRTRPNDKFHISDLRLLDIRDKEGKFLTPIFKIGITIGLKI